MRIYGYARAVTIILDMCKLSEEIIKSDYSRRKSGERSHTSKSHVKKSITKVCKWLGRPTFSSRNSPLEKMLFLAQSNINIQIH